MAEDTVITKKREVVLKALVCIRDSETVEKMKLADKIMSDKKGVSFYCSVRHEFIFIENSPEQSNHVHRMVSKVKQEIPPNIRTKQWQN